MKQPLNRQFVSGVLLGVIVSSAVLAFVTRAPSLRPAPPIPPSYHGNIVKETLGNTFFRRVLYTGPRSQLVVMSIPPGGEVGEEVHKYAEQTLVFLSGTGEAILDGTTSLIVPGDVVVVPAGTRHNFKNTGTHDLKIYTMYAPPNHIDGRVHQTKADADADTADEAVGEAAPAQL